MIQGTLYLFSTLFNFLRKEDLRVDKGFIVLNSGFVTLFSEENIPLIKDFRMLIFVNIADL